MILSTSTIELMIQTQTSLVKDVAGNVLPVIIGVSVLISLVFWVYLIMRRHLFNLRMGTFYGRYSDREKRLFFRSRS